MWAKCSGSVCAVTVSSLNRLDAGAELGDSEFGDEVVAFVARQMAVESGELGFYEWSDRTARYHQSRIRLHLGFRNVR